MKKFLIGLCLLCGAVAPALACTSAIVSGRLNPSGRPLLWKHRDTSTTDNKIEYIAPKNGAHGYVALFNAGDRQLREAWMGMNDAGFAIMNTASYNIKDDKVPQSKMDKEGIVMTLALRTCRTIDDFRRLLDSYPRPIGVEANFGVIDASGEGAFFETNNHSYKEYLLSDSPEGILVRSNYSESGRKDEGYGFVRACNAWHLLQPYIDSREVTPEVLTEEVSRSFYQDAFGRDFSTTTDRWVIDQDFIPRYKSTATIVIEGSRPTDPAAVTPDFVKDQYVMWTGLGYPPCAEIVPVWCAPDGVDPELRGTGPNGRSPMSDRVKARRSEVFPYEHTGNGDKYIDIHKLFNADGTGYVQVLKKQNAEVYRKFRDEGRGTRD